jgi:hypothetical protein
MYATRLHIALSQGRERIGAVTATCLTDFNPIPIES